jgi:hypothetical protein
MKKDAPQECENHDEEKDAVNDATSRIITSEVCFTIKGKYIYAFISNWAEDRVVIKPLASSSGKIDEITILGSSDIIDWSQTESSLEVVMPPYHPSKSISITGIRVRHT